MNRHAMPKSPSYRSQVWERENKTLSLSVIVEQAVLLA